MDASGKAEIHVLRSILMFTLLTFIVPAGAATYYKWVDQNGVTHYSDTAPPKDVQIQKITTSGRQDSTAEDSPEKVDTPEKVDKGTHSDQSDALKAAQVGFCDDVRARLTVLNSGAKTVEFDVKGTNTRPLSPEEVSAHRQELESKLRDFCQSPVKQADQGSNESP